MQKGNVYNISVNIDYSQINRFCDNLRVWIDNNNFPYEAIHIYFDFDKSTDEESNKDSKGNIDALFLSYLVLFNRNITFSKIPINFYVLDETPDGRIYSLHLQLFFTCQILETDKFRLFQYEEYVDAETGEIKRRKAGPNLVGKKFTSNKIYQSKSVTPHIFIDKNYKIFFDKVDNLSESKQKLYRGYKDRLIKQIKSKTHKTNQQRFINSLRIDGLSFIEIILFRLFLNNNLYDSLRVSRELKKTLLTENQNRIKYYRDLVHDLRNGLKELAHNIVNHSTYGNGVISIRTYDKKPISLLKENLDSFLNNRNQSDYIINKVKDSSKGIQSFIDINIVDFGKTSIRQKYIENLEKDKSELHFGDLFNQRSFKKSIDEDIKKLSENSDGFTFKDLFILNINKHIGSDNINRKLIQRIGLHYFTSILKDKANAYLKIKSNCKKTVEKGISDSIIIYNNEDGFTSQEECNELSYGTTFNCIIPIRKTPPSEYQKLKVSNDTAVLDYSSFNNLNNYFVIDYDKELSSKGSGIPIFNFNQKIERLTNKDNRYKNIVQIYESINAKYDLVKGNIVAIDASNINLTPDGNIDGESESDWLRLIGTLCLNYKDIIIYNINNKIVKEIINIRKEWQTNQDDKFIDNNSRILFYSKQEGDGRSNEKVDFRYGATLLTGKTYEQFCYINEKIYSHHYSYGKEDGFFEEGQEKTGLDLADSKLLNDESLLHFDLILNVSQSSSSLKLIEKSIQYSLNTNFNLKKSVFSNNKGYKISKTHFRLGSKMHIEDFYYARKMFQNSFFTIPMAFMLANEISKNKKLSFDTKLSLVGYENYSSFLLSSVQRFLIDFGFNQKNINYIIINKDGKISREPKKINETIITIVPIASTFSTSIKIKNQLLGINERFNTKESKERKLNFIEPFYNLIIVGNKGFDNESLVFNTLEAGNSDKKLYENANWHSINIESKIIKINLHSSSINDDKESTKTVEQKYFIPLHSKWHLSETCSLCFPKNILEEKCLIETSKSSISPKLIFGFPRTKPANKLGLNKLNLTNSLLYGNIKRGNNNYLYFNRVGKLLKKEEGNYQRVKEWLIEVKKMAQIKNDKVVIVTPTYGAKNKFVDLVNEVLFNYSANCLIISLKEDYIENSESLYYDGLYKAKTVLFVDDVLSTLNSFSEINYIVRYIRNKRVTGKGIDYAISMINRMSYSNEESLILKLKDFSKYSGDIDEPENRLFYFSKINNPTIEEPNKDFPLNIEKEKYKKLSNLSSLDVTRELFKNKEYNLRPIDIASELPENIKDYSKSNGRRKNKKLFQLLVLNAIYTLFEINPEYYEDSSKIEVKHHELSQWFNGENIITPDSFENLQIQYSAFIELNDKISKILNKEDIIENHKKLVEKNKSNLQNVILKVLCNTPLIYYKPIRVSVFNWVLYLLHNITTKKDGDLVEFYKSIEKLLNCDKSSETENDIHLQNLIDTSIFKENESGYSYYNNLKFLLKRSVQLKSNFIIHPEFFDFKKELIENLYSLNKALIPTIHSLKIKLSSHKTRLALIENGINESKEPVLKLDVEKGELEMFIASLDARIKKLEQFDPKPVIYTLVGYVQELLFEHETKSFKLEENIRPKTAVKDFKENLKYGNFNHYLRFLKLENTESIQKFWEYFYDKEASKSTGVIKKSAHKKLESYTYDPKYNEVKNRLSLKDKSFINGYIETKRLLDVIDKKDKKNKSVGQNIKKICKTQQDILGFYDVYLTVNYKNLKNPEPKDLFVFDNIIEGRKPIINSEEELKSSLTFAFFNRPRINSIGKVKHTLSNIEIIIKDGSILVRDELLEKLEISKKNTECNALKDVNDANILIVGISNFRNNNENTPELFTQAVFTYIFNKGERIQEEKLRLILALRHQLSIFFNDSTKNGSFLGLVSKKKDENFRRMFRHGMGDYFNFLEQIVDDITQNKD